MREIIYNRMEAVAYARRWAFSRNPKYFDFSMLGGDCTNFASQCLFAGIGVMNFTPTLGWYYRSVNDRSAAWTGVEYFYNFLIGNGENGVGMSALNAGQGIGDGAGPYAEEVSVDGLEIGDFVQFGRETGDYYHTPIVVGFKGGIPLLAAHSYDVYGKLLTEYRFDRLRCLHILGGRTP